VRGDCEPAQDLRHRIAMAAEAPDSGEAPERAGVVQVGIAARFGYCAGSAPGRRSQQQEDALTFDSYDLTRIFGALCASLLLYLGVTYLLEEVYGGHGLDQPAYSVPPLDEGSAVADAEVEAEPPIALLLQSADAERGERLFRRCAACHQAENATRHGIGPALYGIFGRQVASLAGFAYSKALAEQGGTWDWENMAAFLADPKGAVPGTRMTFAGLKKATDIASLMFWLNRQGDSPLPLPEIPEAAAGGTDAAAAAEEGGTDAAAATEQGLTQ